MGTLKSTNVRGAFLKTTNISVLGGKHTDNAAIYENPEPVPPTGYFTLDVSLLDDYDVLS